MLRHRMTNVSCAVLCCARKCFCHRQLHKQACFGNRPLAAPNLQAAAEAAMLRMLCVPEHSRAETKRLLRSGFAREWQQLAEAEAAAMWERFSTPEVVAHLGAVLQRLSRKKAGCSRL